MKYLTLCLVENPNEKVLYDEVLFGRDYEILHYKEACTLEMIDNKKHYFIRYTDFFTSPDIRIKPLPTGIMFYSQYVTKLQPLLFEKVTNPKYFTISDITII